MLKIELVEDWRQSWKWFSTQSMAISIAMLGGWAALPEALQSSIPHKYVIGFSTIVLILGFIGRLIKQGDK